MDWAIALKHVCLNKPVVNESVFWMRYIVKWFKVKMDLVMGDEWSINRRTGIERLIRDPQLKLAIVEY